LNNRELFDMWNDWCSKYKIKMELNNIQFGIKTTQLRNKVKSKTGEDFIIKNTHSYNTIYSHIYNKFFDILDQ